MNDMQTPTLVCIGFGYCARVLAARVAALGWSVAATARQDDKAQALRADGIDAHVWPPDTLLDALPPRTRLLISAPPGEAGDPVLVRYRESLLRQAAQIEWVGYLSTTAVYGDRQGGRVDETGALTPASERGRRRAAAEREWLALADGLPRDGLPQDGLSQDGLPIHTFRLAGIYGPGRGPFEKIRRGTVQRIDKPGQVFGRIHVEDIATVLQASIARPDPGTAYNVTDDLTCPPQEVIGHAADLLGLPRPPLVPFGDAEMSPMARSFYGENKRVANDRIKTRLGVTLAYPTYREGLAAILAAEGSAS